MSKSYLVFAIVFTVLSANISSAAIMSQIDVVGFVSKIYQDKILVYDEGQLTMIPKHFFTNPTAVHVGQPVSVKMSFQESLKLEHPAIPRGKLLHPRSKR